jgi:predicted extracellular nuclease
VGAVLILAGLLPVAAANPAAVRAATELYFSEYIEGSSFNKALEIYNGTGAAVDLASAAYNVQMHFNGNPVAGLTINLTGTIANGDVFVVTNQSASAAVLAAANQVTTATSWYNGDDAVVLRKGTTVIDVIGQIGLDPGTEWGSGLTSTADNTLRRKGSVDAGDPNGADAFDPSIEWDGFATDTFGGLGARSGDAAPAVGSTVPPDGGTDAARVGNITVNFTEPVAVSGSWFSISCATSGTHTATVSGSTLSFVLDPDTDFTANELCTVTIIAAGITDIDTDDPPDGMAADHVFSFTTADVALCGDPATRIHDIQGSGTSTPVAGTVVSIEGVVVGDYQGTGQFGGYYVQEEDVDADADPATSEGIFVFNTSSPVAVGDLVRVRGTAGEFSGLTQLSSVTEVLTCWSGSTLPATTDVTLPFETADYPERFEGMLVRLPQTLVISEYFNFERFGELVLALPLGGESRPFTPTAIVEPGAPAIARALANSLSRITLDDGLNIQNPDTVRHPNGDPFTLANRFRGGDTVEDIVGVLTFGFSLYRIQPTGAATYTPVNPRPASPEPVGGNLRAATMNTLNFFITQDYPTGDPLDNKCGPLQNVECRGADADQPLEFSRQRDKLLAAIAGLDADIVGLNELENTTGVDPLGDPTAGLVTGLNTMLGAGTYAHINTGVIGTDAIRVGLIYKPAAVTPVGTFQILDASDDPRFRDTLNRPVLAQTFMENATGATFTVAVNHLKSKGSDCNAVGDPDTGDGQGNCKITRTLAAQALVDWLERDPTGSGDRDYLILGDLNSYAKEDPIDAILAGPDDIEGTADDYVNLIARHQGTYAYSYVFDGQAGYLDHALASPSLAAQVTGAADWHINADEPDILDYDTTFKPPTQDALFEPNAYRSSDHDPVIVGLDLRAPLDFDGFFPPAVNPPDTHTAKAGSRIPLKFSLDGFQGLDVLAGTPQVFACGDWPDGTSVDASVNPLVYDAARDEYKLEWKTAKAWANSCRTIELAFADGTWQTLDVNFKK